MPTRKQRGHDTERIVAEWFAANGWPYAEPVGSGRPGTDVTGMPGLLIEVKARRDLNLTGWLAQHRLAPVPTVLIHRPDGYGAARIAEWPATMRLDVLTG